MALTTLEKKIAVSKLNEYREKFAQYDAEVREYARQGYRAHYCVHGTNQWTDYDNICGPCEDGYGSWDYLTFLDLARGDAQRLVRSHKKALDQAKKMAELVLENYAGMSRESQEAFNVAVKQSFKDADKIIERYI